MWNFKFLKAYVWIKACVDSDMNYLLKYYLELQLFDKLTKYKT